MGFLVLARWDIGAYLQSAARAPGYQQVENYTHKNNKLRSNM